MIETIFIECKATENKKLKGWQLYHGGHSGVFICRAMLSEPDVAAPKLHVKFDSGDCNMELWPRIGFKRRQDEGPISNLLSLMLHSNFRLGNKPKISSRE